MIENWNTQKIHSNQGYFEKFEGKSNKLTIQENNWLKEKVEQFLADIKDRDQNENEREITKLINGFNKKVETFEYIKNLTKERDELKDELSKTSDNKKKVASLN